MFRENPDRVSYGEKSVTYCIEQGAVETLLISDLLIRGKSAEVRRRIVFIVAFVNSRLDSWTKFVKREGKHICSVRYIHLESS